MKHKIAKRKQKISCGTLTYKFGSTWEDTELLLIKQFKHNDAWGIPKGHLNPGETFLQCAIRETQEETGVSVLLEDRLPDVKVAYRNFDKTVISYIAQQTCDRTPDASGKESEVADARWFKLGDLPHVHPYQKELLEIAINRIKELFDAKYHK
jgi:ADP-ribose pyrophosphatase YjhB (NUDIX family)